MEIKLEKTEDVDEILENSDLDTLAYDKQWKQYRLRLNEKDLKNNIELIYDLVKRAKADYRN